jgi:hypothetical protein
VHTERTRDKFTSVIYGLAASAGLTLLVIVGSRNLEHYDAALFGYTVASVVAFGAVVYRYALWLSRPATRVYWRRGWQLFRQRKKLLANTKSAAATITHNLVEQRFIRRRGFTRWLMHALIMWGCLLSAAITFPLVFGWIHFKLEGERGYRTYLFGFPLNVLDGRSIAAWVMFHALDFTAVMVIAGCAIAIRRRLRDRGAIALQQYMLDFVPTPVVDLRLGDGADAHRLQPLARRLHVLVHLADASGARHHDSLLPALRQALSRRPATRLHRRRTLPAARARNAAGRVRPLRRRVSSPRCGSAI